MTDRDPNDERLLAAFSVASDEPTRSATCPADEEIWAASRGELPTQRTKQLLAHSQDCVACAKSFSLAAGFAEDGLDATTVRPSRARRPQLIYAFGALAAGLMLVATLTILMRSGPIPPPIEPLAQTVHTTLWRVGPVEDEPLTGDESLQVRDRLYLTVQSDVPVHLYVINRDQTGDTSALFPIEDAQWSNPLAAGSHRIPGETTWSYDSWEVSSSGGRETFQVIASVHPLEHLESALSLLDQASSPEVIRSEASPPPGSAGTAALATALGELKSSLPRSDLILQEIVLANPE